MLIFKTSKWVFNVSFPGNTCWFILNFKNLDFDLVCHFNSLKYSGEGVRNKAVSFLDSFIYSLLVKQLLKSSYPLDIGLCISGRQMNKAVILLLVLCHKNCLD